VCDGEAGAVCDGEGELEALGIGMLEVWGAGVLNTFAVVTSYGMSELARDAGERATPMMDMGCTHRPTDCPAEIEDAGRGAWMWILGAEVKLTANVAMSVAYVVGKYSKSPRTILSSIGAGVRCGASLVNSSRGKISAVESRTTMMASVPIVTAQHDWC
jgi:opacity protein-like surface antigen